LKPAIRSLLETELRARVEEEPANPGVLYCLFPAGGGSPAGGGPAAADPAGP
jgi:hypothetical protein